MRIDPYQPKISVVSPVLNNATGLRRCLGSILDQSSSSIELIVIDGGSSDGTLEVIREFEASIAFWETGIDRGISDAFNRGIERATGDFVAILNSDDYWLPNYVQVFADAVSAHPDAEIYYGKVRYFDSLTGRSYVLTPDLSKMHKRMHLFHPAMFVRRDAYKRLGGYSLAYQYAMDAEWCHRAISKGLRFQQVDAELAVMELNGVSDRNYKHALIEYRSSLLSNRLSSQRTVTYYFWKYFLAKSLTRFRWIRNLKQMVFR